jgi:hypothetical protein
MNFHIQEQEKRQQEMQKAQRLMHELIKHPLQVKAEWINENPKQPQRKGIMNTLKKYIDEHKGTLYTLGAIFLVDHFFLKGALRERITKITTGLLDKVQKTLEGT